MKGGSFLQNNNSLFGFFGGEFRKEFRRYGTVRMWRALSLALVALLELGVAVAVAVHLELPLPSTWVSALPLSSHACFLALIRLARSANRCFQFQKRAHYFISIHNEALSIVAVCVDNPDCPPPRIPKLVYEPLLDGSDCQ